MIEYPIYHINKGARKLKVVPDPPEITAYFVSVGHKQVLINLHKIAEPP